MPKTISVRVPPGQAKKLEAAVDLVRSHYGVLLLDWQRLPPEQREKVLAGCPLLKRLLEGVV